MKTRLSLLLIFVVSLAFAQTTQTLEVRDFTKIQAGGNFTVQIKKGDFSVKASGEADNVNNLRAEVKNGELSFYFKEKKMFSGKITLTIQMPQLQAVNFSGGVRATVSGLDYDNFTAYLSGSAEADIQLQATQFYADLSGTANLTLRGKAIRLQANLNGASGLQAFEFPVEEAKIEVGGTAGVRISVSKTLNAIATGTAKIRYKGTPTLQTQAKGLASIKKEM
jgi:Putative auto-transporter adhesin, head GIN domain